LNHSALPDLLRPVFGPPRVRALMTTRLGGVSQGGYASLNLRHGLGDDEAAVEENLARLHTVIGAQPTWLRQVHGLRVLRMPLAEDASNEADACITTEPGVVCAVQVADCLPVLFATRDGRAVGAAHAGWRGLAAGVLEATVDAMCEAAGCAPGDIEAWLGPCIGPRQFEVGEDVLAGFGIDASADHPRFKPQRPGKWLADLAGLARDRLEARGLQDIGGGTWCTAEDGSRFFSFRRDTRLHGACGRMAACVWIETGPGDDD
jgi:polyphenol oxidase